MTILTHCKSQGDNQLACAQAGCDICLENLLVEYADLIWWVVHLQSAGQADYGDLMQEGRIGFWQAVKRFDPTRGVRFSSYAWRVIRHRVWTAVARASKAEGWIDERGRTGDHLALIIANWQETQIREALNEELEYLPERLRWIIVLHYGLSGSPPYLLSEIGRMCGLSRERVRQLRNKALHLLRLPALSIRLRSLCDQNTRQAYQVMRRLNRGER